MHADLSSVLSFFKCIVLECIVFGLPWVYVSICIMYLYMSFVIRVVLFFALSPSVTSVTNDAR